MTTRAEIVQPMPDLSPEQYDALRADIETNGVQIPIVVDQHGRVVDGNNRYAIAAELGIDCPRIVVQIADDDDAIDKAISLNCARRHLTQEQKRELIRAEIQRRPDDSDRAIGRRVGCDHKTVGAVRRELSGGEFPHPDGPLTDEERARLAECEAMVERGLAEISDLADRLHFRTFSSGDPLTPDQARFALYLWLIHLDTGEWNIADNGALVLTCGGERDCGLCESAIHAPEPEPVGGGDR